MQSWGGLIISNNVTKVAAFVYDIIYHLRQNMYMTVYNTAVIKADVNTLIIICSVVILQSSHKINWYSKQDHYKHKCNNDIMY